MRLAAGERHPDVDHRVAGAAALHLGADALLDRRDELPGHDAAHHPLGELEPGAAGERLDLDLADGVLAVAAGLLHVPAERLAGARPGSRASAPAPRSAGPRRRTARTAARAAASACASPIVQSTSWPCSPAPISTRSDGSSAASRDSAVESLSSSDFVSASIAIGSSGVGSDHGRSTRGSSTEESVSPVSARVSRPDRGDVAADHPVRRLEGLAERVGERPDPLVVVVVGVAGLGAEERREVAGHVHRLVGVEGAGEDPHQADPADVRVAGGLHDLGDERPVRVARHRVGGRSGRGERRRARVLAGRREAAHHQVEQLVAAHAARRAGRDDGEEGAARHRAVQVLEQGVLGDRLAGEVAVHQPLVLGLLDDPLDQRGARLGVARSTRRPSPSSPTSPVTSVPDMTGTYNGSTLSPVLPNVACAAASTPG